MRLSTVFELLLIFLLIAFAAYGRVIDQDGVTSLRSIAKVSEGRAKQDNVGVSIMSLKQATENLNKYCTCDNDVCQCCRDFHIPVVSLKGPGCASIRYFEKDNLELQLSFGGNLLTSTVVNGKKPRTICVPMPGGYSKFCGRIYSVERESDSNFKACLGLELQSSYEVEASLRLSCFSFGPEGLKLRPAEAFPPTILSETADDDDDEDDDDDDDDELGEFFDFSDESDNKKDINQLPSKNTAVAGANQAVDEEEEEDEDEDDDDDDYSLGLEALFDIITGDDETEKKKPATAAPSPLTVPVINKPTPKPIVAHATTKVPKVQAEVSSTEAAIAETVIPISDESSTEISLKNGTEVAEEETTEAITESSLASDLESSTDASEASDSINTLALEAAASDDNKQVVKVQKVPVIKKIIVGVTDKKTSITSSSVNAIKNDVKKPLVKPAKPDPVPTTDHNNDNDEEEDAEDIDDDDDDEEDLLAAAVDDDDDEEEESENNEDEDEENDKPEASTEGDTKRPANDDQEEGSDEDLLDDDDDDDDDEEASLMSAIIGDDDDDEEDNKKKNKVVTSTEASKKDEYGFSDLLNRKISRRGRQSKVMRL